MSYLKKNSMGVSMATLIDTMIRGKQVSALDKDALIEVLGENIECESDVLKWVAHEYGVSYSDLSNFTPDMGLVSEFPARILVNHSLFPLRRTEDGVEIGISDLFDTEGIDTLKLSSPDPLVPVLVPSDVLAKTAKSHMGVGADTLDSMESSSLQIIEELADDSVELDDSAQDASIIRFVNQILSDAITQRTTDIHIEPFQDELRVRYRIDGVLHDVPVPSKLKRFQLSIVSRVKILSNLDIAEKRVPQDGRIKLRIEGSEVDVRVSVIPMVHGEAVVMRLLRQDGAVVGLDELDMGDAELGKLRNLLQMPHGIVLVTGPTGSGKTTTLYASLQEINESDRKIITIEDPVEYQIKGINQIQVSDKAGLTFGKGLRAILRHDPDVCLIGEIRDTETAQIAVQASLTGHLVFSTLHTNDSPSALTRLIDMGVEPYLVASSVEAVLAQRLVRVLCPHCKEAHSIDELPAKRKLESLGIDTVYQPVGCKECRNTGYHGRRGIFELLEMNDEIRRLIISACSSGDVRDLAIEHGWRSLSEDGWRLVKLGVTTVEEVLRVTKDVG